MIGTLTRWHLRWLIAARDVLATQLLAAAAIALAGLLALHDSGEPALAAATVLWLVVTVAGLLAGARMISAEHGEGGLTGLMLAPVDRRDLFLSRAIAAGIVIAMMGAITWGLVAALFPGLSGVRDLRVIAVLLIGALGLGPLGALTGWAALSTRAGELIAPVIALPLASPLLIGGLHATEALFAGGGPWTPSLTFATGYAASVAALTYLVSDHVTEVVA